MNDTAAAKIAILLATYNGAAALRAQLDSYLEQSQPPALILISDDGSSDDTRAIVAAFAAAHPELRIELHDGPRMGAALKFLVLGRRCPDLIDIAALSDRDVVCLPEKLRRGARALN